MIKTFQKNELAISLWVGVNGGYITTDEYIDMMQLQNLILYLTILQDLQINMFYKQQYQKSHQV